MFVIPSQLYPNVTRLFIYENISWLKTIKNTTSFNNEPHAFFCQELQYNTCAPSSCSGYNVHLLYELMPCSCKNVGQYSKCISQHIWIITFVAIFRIIIHTVIWYLGCTHVLIFQGNMKHLLILLSYKKLYFIPFIIALQYNCK